MNVTINTDASCLDEVKRGAFAFWIVCDQGKIQKSGKIKGETHGSNHAELCSITNALHTLLHSKFSPITKITINTDSLISINQLTESTRAPKNLASRKVIKEANFLMLELCLKSGRSIREVFNFITFKHIKAHNGKKDSRSFVNDWCDKECTKWNKAILNELKK